MWKDVKQKRLDVEDFALYLSVSFGLFAWHSNSIHSSVHWHSAIDIRIAIIAFKPTDTSLDALYFSLVQWSTMPRMLQLKLQPQQIIIDWSKSMTIKLTKKYPTAILLWSLVRQSDYMRHVVSPIKKKAFPCITWWGWVVSTLHVVWSAA